MSISGKLVAWIVGISVATHLGLEHYRAKGSGTVSTIRRAA